MGHDVQTATPATLEILAKYPWPGNVRELQSVLRQALLQAVGPVLLPKFLPQHVSQHVDRAPANE
jgi:two-component system nitrogen regulation response regulator GlnG